MDVTENPRIEELKRRVAREPASIAFAQLAEEYRRTGDYQKAVDICREGLARHPGYVSARVTLARALVQLEEFADAKAELEGVVAVAPDNLAAIRVLADIHQKLGDSDEAAYAYESMPPPAPPPIAEVATELEEPVEAESPFEAEALVKAEVPVEVPDAALAPLEQWLAAIVADRAGHR